MTCHAAVSHFCDEGQSRKREERETSEREGVLLAPLVSGVCSNFILFFFFLTCYRNHTRHSGIVLFVVS